MTDTLSNAELDAKIIEIENQNGDAVLGRVEKFARRFISYPSAHALVAHVLWIVHTHLMPCWHTTPRLGAMSEEKASGKTRLLEVTETLVPFPILSINASPAYLVRRVSQGEATILFDEIDAIFGTAKAQDMNVDIRSILNGGYRRGAKVHRCVMNGKTVETEELDAFAPVAVAGLRDLPDTLASRAIMIRMKRRAPNEQVEGFIRRKIDPEAEAIKSAVAAWCVSVTDDAMKAEPAMPASIVDRPAECWEPLFIVADMAGGEWPERARKAALHFVAGSGDETRTQGVELLEHIREAFGTDEKLWTSTLLEKLRDRDESPWRDIRGKPLDDRGLGKRLRGYGLKSKDVRIADRILKGYYASDFNDAWARYCSSPSPEGYKGNKGYKIDNENKNVANVALVALKGGSDAQSEGFAQCVHCGQIGDDLLTVAEPNGDVLLHRDCLDAWQALEIPPAFDRRLGAA